MGIRVGRESGRRGWYVFVDRPLRHRQGKGSNVVRRKAGNTEAEARRNAPRIAAELYDEWDGVASAPWTTAKQVSDAGHLSLPEALEEELRKAGWDSKARDRVFAALHGEGIDALTDEEQARVTEVTATTRTWESWIAERNKVERPAASTRVNWETKLRGIAEWKRSDYLGEMTRKDANAYKLYLIDKGFTTNSLKNYIGTFSGFWNWAISIGEIEGGNIWSGLKKGLPAAEKREAIPAEQMAAAESKADRMQDIRFWFGRYQGLRKEDYCGLRWCDIDMEQGTLDIKRYEWTNPKGNSKQSRNLKLKEGGERTVPIHSKLMEKIRLYLPEAANRSDAEPIWPDDYKPGLERWGARWAERHTDRYGFGSHNLRAYVVTKMMKRNINPFFLQAITGHNVPGASSVVAGYVAPSIEEVREVLELLD